MSLKPQVSVNYKPQYNEKLSLILFDCDFPSSDKTENFLLWKVYKFHFVIGY